MRPFAVTLTGLSLAIFTSGGVAAEEHNPVRTRPAVQGEAHGAQRSAAQRVIVKFRNTTNLQVQAQGGEGKGESAPALTVTSERMKALASRAGLSMAGARTISSRLHVMHLSSLAQGEAAADMLARLRADPDVEYAELDRKVYLHATSNDPLALGQWYLQGGEPSAINANAAWDVTKGESGVVVAVIDTGVLFNHPDLKRANQGGRLLPGYDFVSQDAPGKFITANDGDGRDPDPSDPGDWVSAADLNDPDAGCTETGPSSWHGTRVAGMIAALTNNETGIAGIQWNGFILPVRVIGKCGGYNSDVLAGIRWASGLSVPGVPNNPYPAQVVNISLGGAMDCDDASADAIREVSERGTLVVVSAGNEGGPVDSPANCPGAAGIVGLRHAGTKVGFSSLGPQIALGAPGGNCGDLSGALCTFSLDTTSNTGETVPQINTYTDKTNFNRNIGTSFSAPIVSGIAGLMLAANGNLKSTQLIARLQEGATKPFPTVSETGTPPVCRVPTGPEDFQGAECSCTTNTCGAGMANALGSVNAALRPIAAINLSGTVSPGQPVTLLGGGSAAACNHSIASYAWTVVAAAPGAPPAITNANMSTATVPAPTSGSHTIRLTVTDETGRQDSADITLTANNSTTSAPANAGSTACPTPITVAPVLPQVTIAATLAPAEAGPTAGTFTLTRTGDLSGALTVTIGLGGTATNGVDYTAIPASVSFSAGSATAVVTVTPVDDTEVDPAETVIATVQSGEGYVVGSPSSATLTITDNDTAQAPPPSGFGGGGGGGGALDWLTLLAMLSLAPLIARARSRQLQRAASRSAMSSQSFCARR